jgi:hypothetical protein
MPFSFSLSLSAPLLSSPQSFLRGTHPNNPPLWSTLVSRNHELGCTYVSLHSQDFVSVGPYCTTIVTPCYQRCALRECPTTTPYSLVSALSLFYFPESNTPRDSFRGTNVSFLTQKPPYYVYTEVNPDTSSSGTSRQPN